MDSERWTEVQTSSGEFYERFIVPPIFAEWVPRMLDAGGVGPGDRVLDVACGTGIVARNAIDRVGARGSVVGLDLTEAMLKVAERLETRVEWELGDAQSLPFEDQSFDVVLSQAGLMFFPDRVLAMREMHRVLKPGGRLAVMVWGPNPGQEAFARVVGEHFGDERATRYRAPWATPDPVELGQIATAAGFADAQVEVVNGSSVFGSFDDFLLASTAVLLAGEDLTEGLKKDAANALAPYRESDGSYVLPSPGNVATAKKLAGTR